MFAKFLILLIHWRKHGKVNSKFFEFSYAKLKSRNPRTTTINMTMSSVSYFVRYNKTLIDWIYPGNNKFIVPATPTFALGLAFVNSLCLGVQYTCYYPHTIYYQFRNHRQSNLTHNFRVDTTYNYALIAWPDVNPKYHTNASMTVRNIEVIGV